MDSANQLNKFLHQLTIQGLEVWPQEGKLRVAGPQQQLTAVLLSRLKGDKEALLQRLAAITRTAASDGQRGLWFVQQSTPRSHTLNLSFAYHIQPALDVDLMRSALQLLVNRHSALRTCFVLENGVLWQQSRGYQKASVEIVDTTNWTADELNEQIQAFHKRPFSLDSAPLFRALIWHDDQQNSGLALSMHHIAVDGWSVYQLLDELFTLYTALKRGTVAQLPYLEHHYSDYVNWQQQLLRTDGERMLAYWREQLGNDLPLLQLPTDYSRPAQQALTAVNHEIHFSAELSQQLHRTAQEKGATLYALLLAAYFVLLHRYSNQDDIVVGVPTIGRSRPEFQNIIGHFISPLPLRADLSDNPTFDDFLNQVKSQLLTTLDTQDYPFVRLVEQLNPQRDSSRAPIYQASFVLHRPHRSHVFFDPAVVDNQWGHQFEQIPIHLADGWEDITLELRVTTTGIVGLLRGDAALFSEATVARMADHFHNLLEAIVAQSTTAQPINQLPLLSNREYQQMAVEWNATTAVSTTPLPIHTQFEQHATQTPNAIALTHHASRITQITYAELNSRANQLAHHLLTLGVKSETFIAVATDRSPDMVVALLAILKAGGVYIPIDPSYPSERIAYILNDSGATLLLTQSHLDLPALPPAVQVVAIDQIDDQPTGNPQQPIDPQQPAYVIYTSGSTGQPKGVVVNHQSIAAHISTAMDEFEVTAVDTVLQFASTSFDVSLEQIFTPLCAGATLLLRGNQLWTLDQFEQQMLTHRLTVADLPPAYCQQLLDRWLANPAPYVASDLRLIIVGNEKVPPELVQSWQQLPAHNGRLLNAYGPTETTITALISDLSSYYGGSTSRNLPIGRPLPNRAVYILNEAMQPTPIGVAGELYLGGAGVAVGYLNRPDLTATRFIEHPKFGRLYKTGDLCCWRLAANGTPQVEFIGRSDFQVKIRGFRIELGEIESRLLAQDGVVETAVSAHPDSSGSQQQLVAYIVGTVNPNSLRHALTQQLPGYMVPAIFVPLASLPRTPNGKLDRRALPAPDYAASQVEFVPPHTPLEQQLATIWRDLLRVAQIGRHDNFFALGGHSLLATQLVSRVQTQLERDVALTAVFDAPDLATFAHYVSQAPLAADATIPLADRTQPLPLSFAQQRLWFLDQLEPDSTLYNIPEQIRLRGRLNVAALEQSLRYLIGRHESLRTTFESSGGDPMQMIHPPAVAAQFTLPVVSVEGETAVAPHAHHEATTPFNLTTYPLLRAQLLRLAPDDHLLLLTLHHIISDGWSNGILINELAVVYTAYAKENAPSLPKLSTQYADFATWQRQHLSGDRLEQQLAYWRQRLAHTPALLELPTDHPRPPAQSYRGAHHPLTIDAALTAQLNQLAQAHDATLFMLLLAAFNVLLARHSRQTDIVVGSPIANRNRPEIEGLIGFFVNTLVLRTDLDDNPTFATLLARVRETTLATYAHQDVPFEQLVEEFNLERSLSYSPLFQVMLTLENDAVREFALPELMATMQPPEFATAKFDLSLYLAETEAGLSGMIEYATDLFEEATIDRIANRFVVLLQNIVAAPDQPVQQLPLLPAAESHQLIHEWNQTAVNFGPSQTLTALFEQQVAQTPDAIALIYDLRLTIDEKPIVNPKSKIVNQLTYSELNSRANQLAHYLIERGVEPDTLVAVAMERSFEMIIALLAVLKAGGAYVPIDPAYPSDRIQFMLTDSQAPLVLTQSHLVATLGAKVDDAVQLIAVNSNAGILACGATDNGWDICDVCFTSQPTCNPKTAVSPHNLAYVIYTSGSTGQPKGVLLEHGGVCNVARAQAHLLPDLHVGSRLIQLASLSFDAASFEVMLALMHGVTLVVPPAAVETLGDSLADVLRSQRVSHALLVPSILQTLPVAKLPDLKVIITAGEACTSELVNRWAPGRTFFNLYGPTEAPIWTTYAEMQPNAPVHIGRPIPNRTVYILDENGRLAPIGVPGELYFGGPQLARGYLNRPDLTAQNFIEHEQFGRLYKTGDLCRWLPDGNPSTGSGHRIEFLGRTDFQVKIRGLRIELGEIENDLRQQAEVSEAVVLAHDIETPSGTQDKRLVAYCVLENDNPTDAANLRQTLSQSLPTYMVPAAIVILDAMPLLPNGKLNRRALPVPDFADSQAEYVAPRTELEQQLAAIWSDVLGVAQVGVYDNFFTLGGHSLLATQVISRVRAQLDGHVPLKTLFEAAELGAFATAVSHFQPQATATIQPLPRQGHPAYPVSFAQQRLWFLDQMEPNSPLYNIPTLLRLTGTLNVAALAASFRYLIARHESLRTTFTTAADGEPRQVIHEGLDFELTAVSVSNPAAAHQLAQVEITTPFNLSSGPLFRAQLYQISPNDHLLVLTMHHIISDGWSMGVLLDELTHAYRAFSQDNRPTLPHLAIQYADFATWQRNQPLEQQRRYWRDQLHDAPALLELPTDRPRPAVQSFNGANYHFELDADLVAQLNQLAQDHEATLFMVLLAAFNVLLAQYSRQDDITVGTPIANRNRAEVEGLIGFFVNTLVLRTRLADNPSFVELLQQVRQTTLDAYEHQDVGFEQLVEDLELERSLSYSPLFQVMLVLQNAASHELALPQLTATLEADELPFAKFDLSLYFMGENGRLRAMMEYATDLFDEATIARMADHFKMLLTEIVADPKRPIYHQSLLTDCERQQIFTEWNKTAVDFGTPQPLHTLFEQQAARTPNANALIYDFRFTNYDWTLVNPKSKIVNQLTYGELNHRANQLAHFLIAQGITPASRVGVCVERSPQMVAALLAVLKTGAAYVPLDPTYPAERLAYMLDDARVDLLLTETGIGVDWAKTVWLDQLALDDCPTTTPNVDITADHPSYVLYTSGSTGQPKGVEATHRNSFNRLHWMWQALPFAPDEVVCQKTTLAFVDAVWEIFGGLLRGLPTVIIPDEVVKDPPQFIAALATHRVTRLVLVPSLLRALLDSYPDLDQRLPHLCHWTCSGEALSTELCQRFYSALPNRKLLNLYGSSEVAADATWYPTWHGYDATQRGVPIGRPIANTQAIIVNPQLQPVPLGVPGELLIGGEQVAKGYFGREDLSSERFVEWGENGRFFKTGDLCRWLPDGNIDYLGRTDFQVKIRGFRIELGEVESVLLAQDGVYEAVVVAHGHQTDKRLIAYFVGNANPDNLRQQLAQRLPHYMIPSAFVTLDALPLTPNGKLNRRALPAPDHTNTSTEFVPPRTPLEEQLADIWCDVLRVEQVGIHDNFFALGGHSLLATRVTTQIRHQFHLDLPLKTLFETNSLAELATILKLSTALQAQTAVLTASDDDEEF